MTDDEMTQARARAAELGFDLSSFVRQMLTEPPAQTNTKELEELEELKRKLWIESQTRASFQKQAMEQAAELETLRKRQRRAEKKKAAEDAQAEWRRRINDAVNGAFRDYENGQRPNERRTIDPSIAALGLTWPCTELDVKRAVKAARMKAHPDVAGGSHAAFLRVNELEAKAMAFVRQNDARVA